MISSVVIAGDFQFPFGSAAASRVRNLVGGFVDCGLKGRVLSLIPQPRNMANMELTGVFQGVHYEHMASCLGTSIGANSLRNERAFDKLRWFRRAYSWSREAARRIHQLAASGECDLLIIYGRSAWRLMPLVWSAHGVGTPILLDVVEGPSNFSGFLGIMNPIYWDWRAGLHWLPRSVDGAMSISHALADRLRKQGVLHEMIVPSIEDFSDLPSAPKGPGFGEFKLLYVGSLIARDNPQMLLGIMRNLLDAGAAVKLQIVGKYEHVPEGRQIIHQVRDDAILRDHIEFLGPLSDQRLAEVRCGADGLVLLRRNSIAEQESFPTRLVEYLKVGRPVCISDVGDVSHYLKNWEHAVLLDPDDQVKASSTIAKLIQSSDRGHSLGLRGRLRAAERFDRRLHAARILRFACDLPRAKATR